MYSTIQGTRLAIKVKMYNEEILDSSITATDKEEVVRWINGAVGKTSDFSEADLEDGDSLMRLAACKYNACSLMSATLEGHDVDKDALARIRCEEAKDIVRMWGANNGVVPSFDIVPPDGGVVGREVVDYAYGCGTDENCIG